jgi:hypothetical protein
MINAEHQQRLFADQRQRNKVESICETGKRRYALKLIMAKLKARAEGPISMGFLVMCADQHSIGVPMHS